jgi:hypothetical protein
MELDTYGTKSKNRQACNSNAITLQSAGWPSIQSIGLTAASSKSTVHNVSLVGQHAAVLLSSRPSCLLQLYHSHDKTPRFDYVQGW